MAENDAQPIRLDFIADVVCPWCYLGWRSLQRGVGLEPGLRPEITWRSYFLDPTVPEGGVDRAQYMAAKFPDPDRLRGVHATLKAMADELGAPLDLAAIRTTPNTLGAHMLIRLARAAGVQDRVIDRTMTAYFAEGRDIGDPEVLGDIAETAGIGRLIALEALADEGAAEAISAEHRTAVEAGVTGVPFVVVEGRMAVAGAQSPERYALALRKAASKLTAGGD